MLGLRLVFHLLHVTPISLSNSCSSDQTAQRQYQNLKFQFFSKRACVYERLLELKISGISSKLKATYVFVFVRSAILDVSIL